jgi:hypothetical protein
MKRRRAGTYCYRVATADICCKCLFKLAGFGAHCKPAGTQNFNNSLRSPSDRIAFGQGISVTAIQLISAFSAIIPIASV